MSTSIKNILAMSSIAVANVLAYSGELTTFTPALGACGDTHGSFDRVVALDDLDYGYTDNPNESPVCGRTVAITYNGKTVTGTVADKCGPCRPGDIDVSLPIFQELTGQNTGRFECTWEFV